jgi:hypothetical protein
MRTRGLSVLIQEPRLVKGRSLQFEEAHLLSDVFGGPPNLSTAERAIYIAVGLGIAAAGAKPRPNPLLNVLALAGGSYLAWSGYHGRCALKAVVADGQKQLSARSMQS